MNYKFWRSVLGGTLMILGALALVTPFTPGSWLIFIGAEMLGIGILSRANVAVYYETIKKRLVGWMGQNGKDDKDIGSIT